MAIIRAYVNQVPFGNVSIEGLMNENGDFGVAVPQIAALKIVSANRSAKQICKIVGLDLVFEKWQTNRNSRPLNVLRIEEFNRLILSLSQQSNVAAVTLWNSAYPESAMRQPKNKVIRQSNESKVEDFVLDLYKEFNPKRQVVTDFGKADVVHDFGVVEIKEYTSIRSAHTAIGQAMSYGSILNKQPEVLLFNVPEDQTDRLIRLFTAVGILVLLYSIPDTKRLLKRLGWTPTASNITEIQSQIHKRANPMASAS